MSDCKSGKCKAVNPLEEAVQFFKHRFKMRALVRTIEAQFHQLEDLTEWQLLREQLGLERKCVKFGLYGIWSPVLKQWLLEADGSLIADNHQQRVAARLQNHIALIFNDARWQVALIGVDGQPVDFDEVPGVEYAEGF